MGPDLRRTNRSGRTRRFTMALFLALPLAALILALSASRAYARDCPPNDPSRSDCVVAASTARNPLVPIVGAAAGWIAAAAATSQLDRVLGRRPGKEQPRDKHTDKPTDGPGPKAEAPADPRSAERTPGVVEPAGSGSAERPPPVETPPRSGSAERPPAGDDPGRSGSAERPSKAAEPAGSGSAERPPTDSETAPSGSAERPPPDDLPPIEESVTPVGTVGDLPPLEPEGEPPEPEPERKPNQITELSLSPTVVERHPDGSATYAITARVAAIVGSGAAALVCTNTNNGITRGAVADHPTDNAFEMPMGEVTLAPGETVRVVCTIENGQARTASWTSPAPTPTPSPSPSPSVSPSPSPTPTPSPSPPPSPSPSPTPTPSPSPPPSPSPTPSPVPPSEEEPPSETPPQPAPSPAPSPSPSPSPTPSPRPRNAWEALGPLLLAEFQAANLNRYGQVVDIGYLQQVLENNRFEVDPTLGVSNAQHKDHCIYAGSPAPNAVTVFHESIHAIEEAQGEVSYFWTSEDWSERNAYWMEFHLSRWTRALTRIEQSVREGDLDRARRQFELLERQYNEGVGAQNASYPHPDEEGMNILRNAGFRFNLTEAARAIERLTGQTFQP